MEVALPGLWRIAPRRRVEALEFAFHLLSRSSSRCYSLSFQAFIRALLGQDKVRKRELLLESEQRERKIGGHKGMERRTDAMGCCSTYNRNIYDPLNYTVLSLKKSGRKN